tara:strand:- start:17 stop:277 length:261 start_codon:yes stop_codon:yes gene_type:complete
MKMNRKKAKIVKRKCIKCSKTIPKNKYGLYCSDKCNSLKSNIHLKLLEFWFTHQYDEFDNRDSIFRSLDRHTEYDDEGEAHHCYTE